MIWNKNPRLTSGSNMSTKLSGSHSDLKAKSSADDSGNEWKARYEQAAAEIKQLRAQLAEKSVTTVKSVLPEPPTPATMESIPLHESSSKNSSSEKSDTSSSSSSSSSEDSSESS